MRVKSQARAPKILRLGFAERDLSHTEVNKLIFRYRMAGQVIPDFEFKPGFLYNTTRAIAARINQNYDAWPSDQLKKYYKTFIGKPIFVNHMNEDPEKARGVVVAARYVEGKSGDNYIEVVQEVDAQRFPKLAHEIRSGGLDGVSMGVEAGFTICSVCDNKATDLHDMCDHIQFHKGSTMRHVKTGEKTLVYEKCYKLGFFELSYVFDPADETALVSRVIMAKHGAKMPGHEPYELTNKETDFVWSPKSKAYQDHMPPNQMKRLQDPSMTQVYDNASMEEKAYLDPLDFYSPYRVPKEEWQAPQGGKHHTSRWYRTAAPKAQKSPYRGTWVPNTNPDDGKPYPEPDWSNPVYVHRFQPAFARQSKTGKPQPDLWSVGTTYEDPATGARKSRVHGYTDQIHLHNPQMKVSEGGSQKALDSGVRNVHAKVYGMAGPAPDQPLHYSSFNYDPFNPEMRSFYHRDTMEPITRADHAHFGPDGRTHAAAADNWGRSTPPNVVHPPHPSLNAANPETVMGDTAEEQGRRMKQKTSKWLKRAYYGEVVAPEDIDTLRDESEDDTDDFHHWVASPPELRKPDLDQSQRLDQAQENQGLDADRNVENVEEQGAPAPADPSGQEIGNNQSSPFMDEEPENEDEPVMPINPPQTKSSRWVLPKENRMARNFYAEDEGYDGDEGYDDDGSGDDSYDEGDDGSEGFGGPEDGGDDFDGGGDPYADPSQNPSMGGGDPADLDDVHQLLDQAASAIDEYREHADSDGDFGDDGSGDPFGGGDTGYEDPSGDDFGGDEGYGDDPYAADPSQDPSAGGDPHGDEDVPPWLAQASKRPVSKRARRRNSRGGNMRTTLASRNPGARHFTADDNGHTDGGPYGVDDSQGEQEDIFISQVPGAEAVDAPTKDTPQISNSKGNLVAKRAEFDPAHYQRLADTVAAMPVNQRRAVAQEMVRAFTADNARFNAVTFYKEAGVPMVKKGSRYFFAEDLKDPDKVDPSLSGTDVSDLKGSDFESLALDNVETQPKDASVHAFRQFDAWLKKVTGRNAREHGNANYISRAAASYCNQFGNRRTAALNSLFPTLEYVLREARKIEGRAASMNRYAEDKSLEVAAPQGRIDVEAPVKNVTDAEAQASQFDLGDFAHNAGDQIADPELDVVDGNAGTWAPDKGKESSVKLASGTEAMRCAEAYVAAMPNTYRPEDRWRLASMFETLRQPYVRREIRLLEAVLADRKVHTARNKVAAVGSRGTNGIPSGLGSRRTAAGSSGQIKNAAANPETDSFVLFM